MAINDTICYDVSDAIKQSVRYINKCSYIVLLALVIWGFVAFVFFCIKTYRTPPQLDGYLIRERNINVAKEKIYNRDEQRFKCVGRDTNATNQQGAIKMSIRYNVVNNNNDAKRKITYKPEMTVWHTAIRTYYAVNFTNTIFLMLLYLSKYSSDHVNNAWADVINTVIWIDAIFVAAGVINIVTTLPKQVDSFYRKLIWQLKSDIGVKILSSITYGSFTNVRCLRCAVGLNTLPILRNDTVVTQYGADEGINLKADVCYILEQRLALAKDIERQSIKAQLSASGAYTSTVFNIFVACILILLLIMLPSNEYDTSIDVLLATIFSVIGVATVKACQAMHQWRIAGNLYYESAWMLDLANNCYNLHESNIYRNDISLSDIHESTFGYVFKASVTNHNGGEGIREVTDGLHIATYVHANAIVPHEA